MQQIKLQLHQIETDTASSVQNRTRARRASEGAQVLESSGRRDEFQPVSTRRAGRAPFSKRLNMSFSPMAGSKYGCAAELVTLDRGQLFKEMCIGRSDGGVVLLSGFTVPPALPIEVQAKSVSGKPASLSKV